MEPLDLLLPIGYSLVVWWCSTILILYLDGLPRRTYTVSFAAASFLAALSLIGIKVGAQDVRTSGAFLSFTYAIVVWGWHEMAFLMGIIAGPRKSGLVEGASEWQRFTAAIEAILFHELALIATALGIVYLTWEQPNQTGTATFLILWMMRLSAKLNLFLGVRNRFESFLPEALRYLASYFGRANFNLLIPVSLVATAYLAMQLWESALLPGHSPHVVYGEALLASLVSLAGLEHLFLVLPFRTETLWQPALRKYPASRPTSLTS
jgi:putative photosynthetic complex assembly protein 2